MVFFNFNRHVSILLTIVTVWLSLLIVYNTSIYLLDGPTPLFLLEKGELSENVFWITAFYSHIIAACVCLLAGAPLMIPAMLKFRKTHLVLGYVYFNCVLWIAGPTGLMISPVAKGGIPGAIGFLITGIAWWLTTWLGYRAIRNRQIQSHIRWMVRSYAISLSAVAFRLIQIALSYLNVEDTANYIASIYLSLAVSFALAEVCIANGFYFKNKESSAIRNSRAAMGNEVFAKSESKLKSSFTNQQSRFSNQGVI